MRGLVIYIVAAGICFGTSSGWAGGIAGLTPDRRPEGAPVITELVKNAAWYAQALVGIVEPYPASLRFLEDQGGWFTPFVHPGMTGPYDLRGHHAPQNANSND